MHNILLFVCDDLRFDALGCMGNPIVKTPHLDRLAEEGTAFSRCYMPGGTSGAVCMPSRAMLHTGRDLFHIENEGQHIPQDHTVLGEHLQARGYHAFHAGKWHNDRHSFARAFNDGDEIFFGGMGDQWNMPVYHYDPSGAYGHRLPFVKDPLHESQVKYMGADHTGAGTHATTLFTEAARTFVENHSGEKPFFLSVALTAPHDPRNAPQEFHDLYPAAAMPLPENFQAMHPHNTGAMAAFSSSGERIQGQRDEDLAGLPRSPSEIKQHIADYYAMITHLDHEFGRLREALEAKGVWENTIVAFTADHGLAVGQHGLMGKQNIYDHSVRVPLLLCGPGVPAGNRPDQLVCHYDLFKTLCELNGLPAPDSAEGDSLTRVWQGEPGRPERYLAYGNSIRGLVLDQWKLIEYAGPEAYRATQLFDLANDPLERLDLAVHPDYQERVGTMRSRLESLSRSNGDRDHRTGKVYWEHHNAASG